MLLGNPRLLRPRLLLPWQVWSFCSGMITTSFALFGKVANSAGSTNAKKSGLKDARWDFAHGPAVYTKIILVFFGNMSDFCSPV